MKKEKKNFYMKAHSFLAAPIRFFQRVKCVGKENIPEDSGYILCANHIAAKDVILIGSVFPKQIRFVAKKELFKIPILGWLIKKLGAIKLDRGGGDVAAIKKTVELAKNGENVAIFPQGHRYPGVDPGTTPTKNGAALIAYHSGRDVLPVFIKTKNSKYHLFGKVEIVFGKIIKNSDLGFVNGGYDEYKTATEMIFSEILNLGGYKRVLPSSDSKNEDTNNES